MSSTFEPTRVGFIGLSPKSWAAGSHGPYLLKTDKYKIVALSNSSVENASTAIKAFGLPEGTKAYGKPEDIANDPNVDLVVDSVRVDNHLATIRPSIIAGKSVLVEWPLGKNLAEAEELLRLSKEHNVPSAHVVLQERESSSVRTIRKLIAEGRIGKLLSSTYTSQLGFDIRVLDQHSSYMYDSKIGGNLVTIGIGHMLAYLQHALGETLEHHSSLLSNQMPNVAVLNVDGKSTTPRTKDTADTISFLAHTSTTKIPLNFSLRPGSPFKGAPGLDWRIYGEKGEIRFTAPTANLSYGFPDPDAEVIEVHDFASDAVERVKLIRAEKSWIDELTLTARNMGRLYETLKAGEEEHLVTFEGAVQIHRFIDELFKANPIA